MNDELLQSDVAEYAQVKEHMKEYVESGRLERDWIHGILYGFPGEGPSKLKGILHYSPVQDLETE